VANELKRRKPKKKEKPSLLRFLSDESEEFYEIFMHEDEFRSAWEKHREDILREHVEKLPGTRPRAWWRFDAPGPRKRLGGIGTPAHEVLNYVVRYLCGIPTSWVNDFQEAYYNGRARDVHGDVIQTKYRDGDFWGVAVNSNDPPRYEPQAAYLKRHDLLMPGELERLMTKDFEPETVRP